VFRDERGRELFDLPRAPRPDPDTPAPVRLLPDWDNLVIGHADRTRVIDDADRRAITTKNLGVRPVYLIDGRVAGSWSIARAKKAATLTVEPFAPLAAAARRDLEEEAAQVLAFAEPDAADRRIAFAKRGGR
jgi:hypothetical protein